MKLKAKTWVWLAVSTVLVFSFIRYGLVGPKFVPEEFSNARVKGATLAQDIALLSDRSLKSLEEISVFDKEKNTSEALISVSRELIKNREVGQKALELSTELGRMAQNIPNISPARAREAAAEAVGYEIALVSRFTVYNDSLKNLFELLRDKFSGKITHTNGKVDELIVEINATANAINDLNKAFNETMTRFDKIYE